MIEQDVTLRKLVLILVLFVTVRCLIPAVLMGVVFWLASGSFFIGAAIGGGLGIVWMVTWFICSALPESNYFG